MTNRIEAKLNEIFPYLKTIGVRFLHSENSKVYNYTYYLRVPIKCGDFVIVPTRNDFSVAKVVSIMPDIDQIYRGVYGVIQKEAFSQIEKEFKNRVDSIFNLVKERNQLALQYDKLVYTLDQYKKEKENHELFYSNTPDYCF